MAKPTTRQELKDYAYRQLGSPVLDINIDDDQADDLIDDAIQFFNERHYNGVEKMYLKHQLTQEDIDRGRANGTSGVGIVTTNSSSNVSGVGTVTSNWYENSNFIPVPDSVIGGENVP